jgi:hypothetical protein
VSFELVLLVYPENAKKCLGKRICTYFLLQGLKAKISIVGIKKRENTKEFKEGIERKHLFWKKIFIVYVYTFTENTEVL